MSTKIAIVGMACRYGDAKSPIELWENVLTQRRAFRDIPTNRLNHQDYISADPHEIDKTYVTKASVLKDYEFDRLRYRVSGNTYRAADLTHWLALDIAAQALADAGFENGDGLPRQAVRVVVGNSLTGEFSRANLMRLRWPYVRRVIDAALAEEAWSLEKRVDFLGKLEAEYKRPFEPINAESLAGGLANTIAGRICNHFDLKGGGYTVDGACASSLLAVHAACTALATGEADVALAGGVDLSLDPFELVGFARTGALAEDKMRVYDARSAGFWPGEGCGFVVLMRHEDAILHNRPIYAVIRGWGVSSDGTGGITRPEIEGQFLALQQAYRHAGFAAGSVSYFEGHGTGTAVGDAVELQTLRQAREQESPEVPFAVVGSIKANIGHTKAAAGLAGLIKATMAVYTQILPPTTGCETPHPSLKTSTLRTLTKGEPWPPNHPLRAGVSAMGFGGINTHIVLEGVAAERRQTLNVDEHRLSQTPQDAELFVLGGKDTADLQTQIEHLLTVAPQLSLAELTDLAAHLAGNLGDVQMRAAVVATTPLELSSRLTAVLSWLQVGLKTWFDVQAGAFLGTPTGQPQIGYLFPGQASPVYLKESIWGRRFPFAAGIWQQANLPVNGDGVSTAVAQPAIVTSSLIGLRALDYVGLTADIAVGHSLGELTALCWAGAMDETTLLEMARVRGDAMFRLGDATGAMLSLEVDSKTAKWLLNGEKVAIACFNAPQQTVISGQNTAVNSIAQRAAAQQIKTTHLPVSHAFHSPLVAAAVEPLQTFLDQQTFQPLGRSVLSTVTGGLLPPHTDVPDLLTRQITHPVRFVQATNQLVQDAELLIEVGPGHVLGHLVSQFSHVPTISIDANGHSLAGYLKAVGAAYVLGAAVKPQNLFTDRFTRPFDLHHTPTFFTNPCELAPQLAAGTALPAPAPVSPSVEIQPEQPAKTELSPLAVVRQLVSEETELPVSTIKNEDKLLSDLHLNSITVSQLVIKAARQLNLAPPVAPTNYADVTVATIAQTLGERIALAPQDAPQAKKLVDPLAGIESWVHSFTVRRQERPIPAPKLQKGAGQWTVTAVPGHPLAAPLQNALQHLAGKGVVVCLPENPDETHISLLLNAAQPAFQKGTDYFVLVQHDKKSASTVARSFYLEASQVNTCVVTVPANCPQAVEWVVAEIQSAYGFVDVSYDANGMRYEADLELLLLSDTHQQPAIPWLTADDVIIATGGGKGITAECVLALAQQTKVRLALVGNASPTEDAELARNLERMKTADIQAAYYACDITNPQAVQSLIHRIELELGQVTGIVHGAARNIPQLLTTLTEEKMLEAIAPKLHGLQNLLAAIQPDQLRLLVTFGSIIGRSGLNGEAHYGLANEWQTYLVEQFQREYPGCRCLNVEWSVWSKAGMAARLGRIDLLVQTGITPISPEVGIPILGQLLASIDQLPTSVIVTGRYGNIPTLPFAKSTLPFWRFLEEPRLHYAKVELITDVKISAYTDPYLTDHVVQGQQVFPGVMGLEAMAQAAMALMETEKRPIFENVQFLRPIIIPSHNHTKLRIIALSRSADHVQVVIRSEETDFQVDHFRASCHFHVAATPKPEATLPARIATLPPIMPDPQAKLYGPIMFQGKRFQKVAAYQHFKATECVATIDNTPSGNWFSSYLPPSLVLGSPGTRDAFIHAIQVCTPHKVLLPVSVERIVVHETSQAKQLTLYAHERVHKGETYIYDLVIQDEHGQLVEQWHRLELHSMSGVQFKGPWAAPLLGPYLERSIQQLLPHTSVQAGVVYGSALSRQERSDLAIQRALGKTVVVHRRTDGKPELLDQDQFVSASHIQGIRANGNHVNGNHVNGYANGGYTNGSHVHGNLANDLTLAVAGPQTVSCDIELVAERPVDMWQVLLGQSGFALSKVVNQEHPEPQAQTATRIWAAKECLEKAGAMTDAPLILTTTTKEGWVVFTSGGFSIVTAVLHIEHQDTPLALAVLVANEQNNKQVV